MTDCSGAEQAGVLNPDLGRLRSLEVVGTADTPLSQSASQSVRTPGRYRQSLDTDATPVVTAPRGLVVELNDGPSFATTKPSLSGYTPGEGRNRFEPGLLVIVGY
jgi:hypothetical protein